MAAELYITDHQYDKALQVLRHTLDQPQITFGCQCLSTRVCVLLQVLVRFVGVVLIRDESHPETPIKDENTPEKTLKNEEAQPATAAETESADTCKSARTLKLRVTKGNVMDSNASVKRLK